MTDEVTLAPDEPERPSLRVDAPTDFGFEIDDYAIEPEDQALADEIRNFDPVFDVPGSATIKGNVKLPTKLTLSALSPDMRAPIEARLAETHPDRRDALEQELVAGMVYGAVHEGRMRRGAAGARNAYEREWFAISIQSRELEREWSSLQLKLGEIDHVRHDTDPRTGKVAKVIVNKVEGYARQQMEGRLSAIQRHVDALNGYEGERRLAKALKEAIRETKAQRARVEELREVDRRSAEMVREDRINEAAKRRAAIRKSEI